MMTIDQMELLFCVLIAQNKDTKIRVIFPDYTTDETTTLKDCDINKETYGPIETIEIFSSYGSVVRFRRGGGVDKEQSFVTWDYNVNAIFEEYEQYLSHLLKFVSFEDKV